MFCCVCCQIDDVFLICFCFVYFHVFFVSYRALSSLGRRTGSVWLHASRWVWAKCVGTHRDIMCVVKHCCQRYRPTGKERLRCPACGAHFPSGSKVTQLWFDIVCECIWCVCACVCVWERGTQARARVSVYALCMLTFLCMSILVCACSSIFRRLHD